MQQQSRTRIPPPLRQHQYCGVLLLIGFVMAMLFAIVVRAFLTPDPYTNAIVVVSLSAAGVFALFSAIVLLMDRSAINADREVERCAFEQDRSEERFQYGQHQFERRTRSAPFTPIDSPPDDAPSAPIITGWRANTNRNGPAS
ncbi:hypothetical protein HY632_04480 [Candidatus Uhrbacteria bacterium]|nr:hypothetical protein [Candidatus Uhrbacteria bacterium]